MRVMFTMVIAVLALAACGSSPSPTGFGGTRAAWDAHHGTGYTDVLTDTHGHVYGYVLTLAPQDLSSAIDRVQADLPADATHTAPQLQIGIEGTKCQIVDFTSATLKQVLGDAAVTAVFQTDAAITMDTSRISHAVVASAAEHLPRAC